MTHEVSPHVTCHACGACFDRKGWSMLALVERIAPEEAQRILVDWPNEYCIEIRACRRCAREVLAKGDAVVVERRRAIPTSNAEAGSLRRGQ